MDIIHCERYEIELPPVSRTRFGSVYRAVDLLADKSVVVKTVSATHFLGLDQRANRRGLFRDWAEAARVGRASEHIARVRDFGYDQSCDIPYLVMDDIPGRDLCYKIGNMSLEQGTIVLVQMLKALRNAHNEGLVHGDISPASIIRVNDATGMFLLNDFGLARSLTRQLVSHGLRQSVVIGQPGYLPPMDWQNGTRSFHSDLFGLAATVLHLVGGRKPEYQWSSGSMTGPDLQTYFDTTTLDRIFTFDDFGFSGTDRVKTQTNENTIELYGRDIVDCLQNMIDDEDFTVSDVESHFACRSIENADARKDGEAREKSEATGLSIAGAQASGLRILSEQSSDEPPHQTESETPPGESASG